MSGDRMIANCMELRGGDEYMNGAQVVTPNVYMDGTVELSIDLIGKDRVAFIRFSLSDLVAIATTTERQKTP